MIFILFSVFFLFVLISFFLPKERIYKSILFFVLGLVLILIAGFRSEVVDRDYANYVTYFHEQDYLAVEPAFVVISKCINSYLGSNPIYLFVLFATIGVSFKSIAIRQLTELWFLSLVIYLSNFFILHEMTQIRAGVASAFLLLCVKPIYDRDLKRFLLFAILGFTFHYSAIVILPLWFLGIKARKKALLFSLPVAYIIYFSGINLITTIPISVIQNKIAMYQTLMELGNEESILINVFNLVFLAKIVVFYFLLSKYELILSYNKYTPILMKIYCISLMSYLVLAVMPPIATRINELFAIVDIILIPFIYYAFKPVWFSKSIVVFIGICFLLINLFYVKLIVF
ncbi:EpsG family protein [Flavobacterium sp. WC2416]|uniref:EpsG family protein n=1 Tax=Flavobacterium sp. WC2416 TaxID=3234141 RepID=A0AB39WD91_9FLAO